MRNAFVRDAALTWLASDLTRRRELARIVFLLRHKLIIDLIPPILEYADCFDQYIVGEDLDYEIMLSEREAPRDILVTPPVVANVFLRHPVRAITFEVRSHGKGWVGGGSDHCWTWFTTRLIKYGHETPSTACHAPDMDIYDSPEPSINRRDRSWTETADPEKYQLFRNPAAVRDCQHKVEWRADFEKEDEAGFVRSVEQGDETTTCASRHKSQLYTDESVRQSCTTGSIARRCAHQNR
ncbi:hypothetical protein ANO11243_021180 [Dothideomycetidae sp. 11243]|nr:hypothetical protein ANO11243_021180 [fungal sp. No.11243]